MSNGVNMNANVLPSISLAWLTTATKIKPQTTLNCLVNNSFLLIGRFAKKAVLWSLW